MPVKILCPNPACGASAEVDDSRLGRDVRCTKCGEKFALIPATRAEAPETNRPPAPVDDDDSKPSTPAWLGRFRVVRELGRGGMGAVYLAEDAELGRLVAMKVPHPSYRDAPEVRERLLREARVAAQFRHPNFCPILDIGEAGGVPYLRMSYIEGRTLASLIEPGRPWSRRKAVEVARQLAVALGEAHRRGIVHRDLKPANVMVDLRGSLVIMDFGLALRLDADDPRLTSTGAILGTPAYMPPEQVEGDHDAVGPRSDIYALGVILFELLTSRRPFEGSTARVLGQVVFAEPPAPSSVRADIAPRLDAICLKAMAKKPEDRFRSMDEFASALRGWLDSRKPPIESRLAWPSDDLWRPRLRPPPPTRPPRRAGLAVAFVLAAGLIGFVGVATLPDVAVIPPPRIAETLEPREAPRPAARPEPPRASNAVPRPVLVSTPTATLEPIPREKPESVPTFEEVGPPHLEPKVPGARGGASVRKSKRRGSSGDREIRPAMNPEFGGGPPGFP